LVHINENLVEYRLHDQQDSRKSPNLIEENENLWSLFAKEVFEDKVWSGPHDSKIILSHLIGHLISTNFQRSVDFAGQLLIDKIELDILKESTQDYKIINVRNNHLKQRNIENLKYLESYYNRFSDVSKIDEHVNFMMMLLGGSSVLVDTACGACKENKKVYVSHDMNFKSFFCKKIRIYSSAMDRRLTDLDTPFIANFVFNEIFYRKNLISMDCECEHNEENLVIREIKSNPKIQKIIFTKVILSLDSNSMNYAIYKNLKRVIKNRYKLILIIRLVSNWIIRRLSNS
jgi:hypothetical protein